MSGNGTCVILSFEHLPGNHDLGDMMDQSVNDAVLASVIDEQNRLLKQDIKFPSLRNMHIPQRFFL